MNVSHDFGVWVSALLTLFVFSFLYRDNPLYKFAEHLFVGVSAGYYMVLNFWTVIVTNLWDPLVTMVTKHQAPFSASLGDYRIWLVVPGIFGIMMFARLLGRVGWLSRWPLAVIIGVYAGLKTTGFAQGDLVAQVQASLQPLLTGHWGSSINNILFMLGIISSLLFFFYSREHKGVLGVTSRLGVGFLMVSFGAGYGYTVMSRISLLIGRFQFLIHDWLGLR